MTSDADVRRARPDDVEGILDLFEDVAAERKWIATEPGFDRDRKRERVLASMGRPRQTPCWIACDGALVAGNLSVFEDSGGEQALGMMVRASHRRRGIGRALLLRCLAWAREHQIGTLSLEVFPHNAPALALYREMGFLEIERRERAFPRQNGEVWDSIRMRKAV